MDKLNIYQRINAIMQEVEYVKKDANVQGYKAVTHDQVTSVLRKSIVSNGVVIRLEQKSGDIIEKRDVDKGIKMHLYTGLYDVHFVNIDDPQDFLTVSIEAHAQDNGDKAPGKAASYATKYAMLKLFTLETGENDESRTFEPNMLSEETRDKFHDLLNTEDALGMSVFLRLLPQEEEEALYKTFEKGKISSSKTKVRELCTKGNEIIKGIVEDIKTQIKNEDPAISETVGELTADEKRVVSSMLEQYEITYLRNLPRE